MFTHPAQARGKQSDSSKIVAEHMADLGKRRFPEIARRMGISVEQVQKCANNIAQLDPRPGAIFAQAPQNYVLPDVTVEKINGEYQVILNGEQIPHLRISNTYKDIMSQDGNGSEVIVRDKIRAEISDQIHPSTATDISTLRTRLFSAGFRSRLSQLQ
jgi:RNA polymerase sigma-54 factor